jgi:hypothetical protein
MFIARPTSATIQGAGTRARLAPIMEATGR